MRNLYNRSRTGTAYSYPVLTGIIGSVVLVLFLSSCSTLRSPHYDTHFDEDAEPPRYSLVFIIHGDSNYLYHDADGNQLQANEEALSRAKRVAQRNKQAEVFIFHQRSSRRVFGLFYRRSDGEFYYYRNGMLIAEESYRRDHGESRFDPEAELYTEYRFEDRSRIDDIFFYFGHEIPEVNGKGYDVSYRNESFTVADLAGGLKKMTEGSDTFDLIVLSTCTNGTPYIVSTLSPYARYIIASPVTLHLSYFDLEPFESLRERLQDEDIYEFARSYARVTFDRLTSEVHTAVSVALYDVERVREYLNSVDSVYKNYLTEKEVSPVTYPEYIDCADDSVFAMPGMSEGVDILYRPPRFGRSQNIKDHSGWTCRRLHQTPNPPADDRQKETGTR